MDKATFVANLAFVKKRKTLLYRIALIVLFMILAGSMYMSKAHPGGAMDHPSGWWAPPCSARWCSCS